MVMATCGGNAGGPTAIMQRQANQIARNFIRPSLSTRSTIDCGNFNEEFSYRAAMNLRRSCRLCADAILSEPNSSNQHECRNPNPQEFTSEDGQAAFAEEPANSDWRNANRGPR